MTEHVKDSDCTLDATGTCVVCGVYHGDPCEQCGGRGFHNQGCPLSYVPDSSSNTTAIQTESQGREIMRGQDKIPLSLPFLKGETCKGIKWPGHSVLPPEAAFSPDPAIRGLYWASVPGSR